MHAWECVVHVSSPPDAQSKFIDVVLCAAQAKGRLAVVKSRVVAVGASDQMSQTFMQ